MKQCEICLDNFQENRFNQKYCTECGKDPAKTRKHYAIATYINKKNAGELEPKPVTTFCRTCNKKIISIYSKNFCSTDCLELHRKHNGRCLVCRQLLIEKGNTTGRGFCSEACRKERQIRTAKEKGNYIPCKICGKEFISKNYRNIFCSRDCLNKHNENQKKIQVKKEMQLIKKNCEYCNKEFMVNQYRHSQQFCSRECSQNNNKLIAKQKKEEEKEQLKIGEELNICTICKTSQKDCERFTSKFVYMPLGAKKKEIEGRFVITECPKFQQ